MKNINKRCGKLFPGARASTYARGTLAEPFIFQVKTAGNKEIASVSTKITGSDLHKYYVMSRVNLGLFHPPAFKLLFCTAQMASSETIL